LHQITETEQNNNRKQTNKNSLGTVVFLGEPFQTFAGEITIILYKLFQEVKTTKK
jgi:hypothetical protein